MSHGDEVVKAPVGFDIIASSESHIAAISNKKKNIFGLQFHPEVIHTVKGKLIIKNFIFNISNIQPIWRIDNFLKDQIFKIKEEVRDDI